MANETQNASPVQSSTEQVPVIPSVTGTTTSQPQLGIEFHKAVGEATKYTVFAIFVLYSIGFIIWHAYLGGYGVSTIAFLQAEYLAAAFCYLFVFSTIAIPPVLLLRGIMRNIKSKGLIGISNWEDDNWLFIGSVWFFLILRVLGVFLPGSIILSERGQYAVACIVIIFALHVILIIIYVGKTGYLRTLWDGKDTLNEKTKAWRSSKIFKFIANQHVIGVYTLCLGLIFLVFNPKINGWFLFSTMFLYSTATYGISSNFFETWKKSSLMTRALVVVLITLILISNIQSFAVSQFGEIPKSAGGGKPETVYIKLSLQNSDVAASMNIPAATNVELLKGFVGPIGVLLRSDKEILFINYADTNSSEYVTNDIVLSITTNLVTLQTTNSADYQTVKHGTRMANQIIATLQTNITYNVSKNILKNPIKLTARQVRSDLVDAIIFTQ
jgi:hypothetical protein